MRSKIRTLLNRCRKARGAPCEPGETAANTGCKPAEGEGGPGAEGRTPDVKIVPIHGGGFRVVDLFSKKPISPPLDSRAAAASWASEAGYAAEGQAPASPPASPPAAPATPIPSPLSGKRGKRGRPAGGKKPKPPAAGGEAGPPVKINTREEATKFAKEAYGAWAAGLSPEERDGLSDYANLASDMINGYLRGKFKGIDKQKVHPFIDRTVGQAVKNIDEAIAKAPPLSGTMTVYRGVTADQLSKYLVGGEFTDPGFCSTTAVREVAEEWEVSSAQEAILLEIDLPPGTKAAAFPAVPDLEFNAPTYPPEAAVTKEAEWLLPRGSRFRVASKGRTGRGKPYVKLEYVQ